MIRKYIIKVKRGSAEDKKGCFESFVYESENEADTVAAALTEINSRREILNSDNKPARRIEWECSCLQKKCGACAMVINGKPSLACGVVLKDIKGDVVLEPLKKFPLIRDLCVDRSIMYDNLLSMKSWLKGEVSMDPCYRELAYEASECIQCGCCLEVCPNFYAGGRFYGMSVVPLTMRLLSEQDREDYKELARAYTRHEFEGCGKSLACRNVCPKGIDIEKLLVNSNALAVWKRKKKQKL